MVDIKLEQTIFLMAKKPFDGLTVGQPYLIENIFIQFGKGSYIVTNDNGIKQDVPSEVFEDVQLYWEGS